MTGRFQAILTDQPDKNIAMLEYSHRQHAHVEDRIRDHRPWPEGAQAPLATDSDTCDSPGPGRTGCPHYASALRAPAP